MSDRRWHLEGKWLEYCSCDHGCPCEAMAPPTHGHCEGAVAFKVDEGFCDDVRLDGLSVATTFFFPRALHHGGGHMQPILEERTTEAQRDALFYILSGEGQPVGTMFQIFSVIVDHLYDPVFTTIDLEWDISKRRARLHVPNQLRARTEPILNPVTDMEHRMVTVLPDGWVFHEGEVGSGFAKSLGELKFDLSARHSSLAYFAWNQDGMALDLKESRARYPLTGAGGDDAARGQGAP